MSHDGWFLDRKTPTASTSATASPSPTRKAYASPIFQIVPDPNESKSPNLTSSNPITPTASPVPQRREVLKSPASLFTRTASTPSILRASSPLGTPLPGATCNLNYSPPRPRSRFARSTLDLFPTEPRSYSSLSSPVKEANITRTSSCRFSSPSPTRRYIPSPLTLRSTSKATTEATFTRASSPRPSSRGHRSPSPPSPSKSPTMVKSKAKLKHQESTCVSSTTTTTKVQEGKGLVAQSVSSTSITIKNRPEEAMIKSSSAIPSYKAISSASTHHQQSQVPVVKCNRAFKQHQQHSYQYKLQTSKPKATLVPPAVIESRPPVTSPVKKDPSLYLSKPKKSHVELTADPFVRATSGLSPSPLLAQLGKSSAKSRSRHKVSCSCHRERERKDPPFVMRQIRHFLHAKWLLVNLPLNLTLTVRVA